MCFVTCSRRVDICENQSTLNLLGGPVPLQRSQGHGSRKIDNVMRDIATHVKVRHSFYYYTTFSTCLAQPLHVDRVNVTVNDRSPVVLVHYLFALGESGHAMVAGDELTSHSFYRKE